MYGRKKSGEKYVGFLPQGHRNCAYMITFSHRTLLIFNVVYTLFDDLNVCVGT